MKNEMLAMILAGGKGTRLGKLTQNIAKPAVPFGGRYRIIDFTLSNCVNSGIKNIGVVTQYQPLVLNNHIGNGASWGLDRLDSGVTILQPYSNNEGSKWFEGTSHAIYQNIDYIESMDPEYLLVLSGDHIYKMDYEDMLAKHKKSNAALSVAVIDVPWDEASRNNIFTKIIHINVFFETIQQHIAQSGPSKDIDPHRSVVALWFFWLFFKFNDPVIFIGIHDPKKMLFHFTLRVGIMCRLITSRATGKMLGRSILYGQRIWNLSTMKVI